MLTLLKRLLPFDLGGPSDPLAATDVVDVVEAAEPAMRTAMRDLVEHLHFEIVPMTSIEEAIDALPAGSRVSITCSPAKGIAPTLEYVERLIALGHRPIPHIAARLVEGPDQAHDLARWAREHQLSEVFVVAGDAPEPTGAYEGALPFIRDFLAAEPGVERVGITGYPDGHALIDTSELDSQLLAKQAVLHEFGVGGWISTQMCFDDDMIRTWIREQRAAGVTLPIRLGVPGVVDRTRLMKMGTRLGIGASLRFLAKNRSTVMQLMAPGGFDPTELVVAFADDAEELGIEALHAFTFNAVADTRAWQEAIVEGASTT
jgi:methylenetetrahydrofolate reductase (NADPH)